MPFTDLKVELCSPLLTLQTQALWVPRSSAPSRFPFASSGSLPTGGICDFAELVRARDPGSARMRRADTAQSSRAGARPRASAFIFVSFLLIAGGLAVLAFPYAVDQVNTLQRGFERYFPDPSHAGLTRSFQHMGASAAVTNAGVVAIENARGVAISSRLR